MLNEKQMRVIIESARKTYEKLSNKGNVTNPIKSSCHEISSLIYHIANEILDISDKDNKVYQCKFSVGTNPHLTHTFNKLLGMNIDASIDQFNQIVGFEFSPYENNDKYYMDVEEVEPLNINVVKGLLDYCDVIYGQEIEFAFKDKLN